MIKVIQTLGIRQIGKAADSESAMYWFEPSMPNILYQLLSLVINIAIVAAFLLIYFVIGYHTCSLKDSQKDSQKLIKKETILAASYLRGAVTVTQLSSSFFYWKQISLKTTCVTRVGV